MSHTPGPWMYAESDELGADVRTADDVHIICNCNPQDAPIIAAAPDLVNGINALLGLLQLVCMRDDMPAGIKDALQTSHRVDEAKAALAKAVQS